MTYSNQTALDCARASYTAYSDDPKVVGYKTTAIIEIEEAFVFVCENDNRSIVAWRGTDDFKDAITDLNYVKTDWEYGRVHKGFAETFLSTRGEVIKAIPKNKPYIVTGHSLGAADATLEASLGFSQSAYVFGCPRVGNGDFTVKCPIWRHEKKTDIVPFIPPRTSFAQMIYALTHRRMPTLYKHIGTRVEVSGFGHGMAGYLEGVIGITRFS